MISPFWRLAVNITFFLAILILFTPGEVYCADDVEFRIVDSDGNPEDIRKGSNNWVKEASESMIDNTYIKAVKQEVAKDLHSFVRQDDFLMVYKSHFYSEKILDDAFIWKFVNNVPWKTFLADADDLSESETINRIYVLFFDYLKIEQRIYEKEFIRKILIRNAPWIVEFILLQLNYRHWPWHEIKITTEGAKEYYNFKWEEMMRRPTDKVGIWCEYQDGVFKIYVRTRLFGSLEIYRYPPIK